MFFVFFFFFWHWCFVKYCVSPKYQYAISKGYEHRKQTVWQDATARSHYFEQPLH